VSTQIDGPKEPVHFKTKQILAISQICNSAVAKTDKIE
jgi:hypothetical protein